MKPSPASSIDIKLKLTSKMPCCWSRKANKVIHVYFFQIEECNKYCKILGTIFCFPFSYSPVFYCVYVFRKIRRVYVVSTKTEVNWVWDSDTYSLMFYFAFNVIFCRTVKLKAVCHVHSTRQPHCNSLFTFFNFSLWRCLISSFTSFALFLCVVCPLGQAHTHPCLYFYLSEDTHWHNAFPSPLPQPPLSKLNAYP